MSNVHEHHHLLPARDEFLPKVYLGSAVMLVVFHILTVAIVYPTLPDTVATHYGWNGTADAFAQKSYAVVFLLPFLQALLTVLFLFIYQRPHYMHIPSSLLVELLPEPYRSHIYAVFRKTVGYLAVLVNILFSYIGMSMLLSAQGESALNPWILYGLLLLVLLVAVVSSLGSWHIVEQAVHHHRRAAARHG